MTDHGGGACGAQVDTPITNPAPATHQSQGVPSAQMLDQPWRPLLCLLRPPLLQIFRHLLPTSSSSLTTSAQQQHNARTDGFMEEQVGDCEGSERTIHSTPTPSSSQQATAAKTSATHATTGKRALSNDAVAGADEASPVHKKTETAGPSSSVEYKLALIQEPTIGAAFEDNLLGRIGVAPPLIIELQILKDGRPTEACEELPFLICQCTLLDEQGVVADMMDPSSATTPATAAAGGTPSGLMRPTTPTGRTRRGRRSSSSRQGASASASAVPGSRSSESTDPGGSDDTSATATPLSQHSCSGQDSPQLRRMLYGTIVAGPQQYAPEGGEGTKPYFFFPELSIRKPGRFRIRCRLMRLTLPGLQASSETGVLASVETKTFEVVNRSQFAAPYITDISRHFARQGVPLLLPPGVSAD